MFLVPKTQAGLMAVNCEHLYAGEGKLYDKTCSPTGITFQSAAFIVVLCVPS